jgi:expansin (peptidoglycan-binding protein)
MLNWVKMALGGVETAITGSYHAIRGSLGRV